FLVSGDSTAHQIFNFADGQGWQFLAVTEHQLANVQMSSASPIDPIAVIKDRRWTTLQEVRLLSPSLFSRFLTGLNNKDVLNHDRDNLQVMKLRDASDLYGGELL